MSPIIKRYTGLLLCGILSLMLLAGCGGGGGGGTATGAGGGGSVSYTGSNTKATVDTTNAQTIATDTYQGGSAGSALGGFSMTPTREGANVSRPQYFVLAQTFEKVIQQIDLTTNQGNASKAIITDSFPSPGDCGGSALIAISINDVTGDFSGTVNFSNYCSFGVTSTGSVNYTGKFNLISILLEQFTITFNNLTVLSGGDSFTVANGNFSYVTSGATDTVTMSMLQKDNITSEVFKIENLIMKITDFVSYDDIQIVSGRFYHPAWGFVDVVSELSLRFFSGADWPSQGRLLFTGDVGPGGLNTKAKLTVISTSLFQVDADTTGDGIFDFTSGPLLWSAL